MRIAVLSDTHFGDPLSTLVTSSPRGEPPTVGPAYEALARAVGEVDYLVLLGDIIDFSIASYDEAYRHARCFFKQLSRDGLAREIVYVPGNHDFDVWHTVEHQVNVINRLGQGQLPRAFKRSVPGLIDDRRRTEKFLLPDVVPKRGLEDPEPHYGNLFFDAITLDADNGAISGDELNFNFAYPNLYLVTENGECLLLTHGHYFEAFWSAAAEWTSLLAHDDLGLERGDELTLREMVGINLPLNQLACTGIGQAQPLAQVARKVQQEIGAGRTETLSKYFDRLEASVRGTTSIGWAKRRLLTYVLRWARRRFLSVLAGVEHTRYSREFLTRPSVRDRFRQYYRYSLAEIERLRDEHGLDIPAPRHVVFGHTHQPIPWNDEELADEIDGVPVEFCNTGGWLLKEEGGTLDFVGAEVLVYESGVGVSSVSIRTEDVYPVANEARSTSGPDVAAGIRAAVSSP